MMGFMFKRLLRLLCGQWSRANEGGGVPAGKLLVQLRQGNIVTGAMETGRSEHIQEIFWR